MSTARHIVLSEEDRAKRAARAALFEDSSPRRSGDRLAERQRLIAFWKKCAETNPAYIPHNGAWWHVFIWNGCFRYLCMPRLRAMLDARDRAREQRYREELREISRQWEQAKAERAAAKKAAKHPQAQLFVTTAGAAP